MRSFHTALSCLALVSMLSAAAAAGDVWVVDASGSGDFLDIQAAVDAASDDDTLLIMGGTYGGFSIASKELALASDSPQTPRVNGLVTLSGLAKGGGLSLSGLHLKAGFKVNNCKGTVLFTDCTFLEPGVTTNTSGKPSQTTRSSWRIHSFSCCRKSTTTTVPPGCTMRAISRRARSRSGTLRMPKAMLTASKLWL